MARNASDETSLYRLYLLLGGGIYLAWWFAVAALLPHDFNPLTSRIFVVGLFLLAWCLSFVSNFLRTHLRGVFKLCLWLLTFHFFYLFLGNSGSENWIIGSFITVLAATYLFESPAHLLAYTGYVAALGGWAVILLPALRESVFFPGITTILLQANISLFARQRALARLRESNERFQLLFDSTSEGVLLHEDRRIVSVNEALRQIFGYPGQELLGWDPLDLIDPAERPLVEARLLQPAAETRELLGRRKDGSPVDLEVKAKNVTLEGRTLRLVTFRDLSDRKRAENERLAARAMEARLAVLDEFITLASHELKTPVTSMKLWMQLLDREAVEKGDTDPRRVHEIAALMNKQINRLSTLIGTMLNTSQLSTGRLTLERVPCDLAEIVRHEATVLGPESARAGSSIHVTAPPALELMGDPDRLRQVVNNLLLNAIKYGNRRPVTVSLERRGDEAVLIVSDEGIGIRAEDRERIFERFERAVDKDKIAGLGLGLYLVKRIVEAHGGRVDLESELGKGAKFIVRIPAGAQ